MISPSHYTNRLLLQGYALCQNDLRWLVLDSLADSRERILMDYIEDLHKRGPPPPPTATEPLDSRRKRLP
jgi:hypothetical protein